MTIFALWQNNILPQITQIVRVRMILLHNNRIHRN